MVTAAIVLAGGLGTRLRGEVPDLPKPMAPVNGRPFLEHQLDYWLAQGIRHFILSVGYRREVIMEHFGDAYRGARINYAVETEPLGTGGGLFGAMALLDDEATFLLLNGDTFFELDLARLAHFHEQRRSDWTFSLFRAGEAGRYMGLELDAEGRILSLRAGTDDPGRLANGGVYLVSRSGIATHAPPAGGKASLEDDILPAMMAAGGRLFGLECEGRFIDIGVPHDYRRAGAFLAASEAAR